MKKAAVVIAGGAAAGFVLGFTLLYLGLDTMIKEYEHRLVRW